MAVAAKICGLSTSDAVATAIDQGARYLGFVFYPRSPRNVTPAEAARLAASVPPEVKTVAVFVDATDAEISAVLAAHPFDFLQLHGTESVARVAAVRHQFGRPVIKAISVAGHEDIEKARQYTKVADMLLFDAKAPKSMADALPGGNGLRFDWELLASHWPGAGSGGKPWLLSGGLDAGNVAEAVRISGARLIDVSSGVEDRPGVKSLSRIRDFLGVTNRL